MLDTLAVVELVVSTHRDIVNEDVKEVVLLAENENERVQLLGTAIGTAVVNYGWTKSVCGDVYLNTYLESLSQKDRK